MGEYEVDNLLFAKPEHKDETCKIYELALIGKTMDDIWKTYDEGETSILGYLDYYVKKRADNPKCRTNAITGITKRISEINAIREEILRDLRFKIHTRANYEEKL